MAASLLREHQDEILAANLLDQQQATQENISKAMLDRLSLNASRVEAMAKGLEEVAVLADPLHLEDSWRRPNGILIRRVRVPLGLIAIIYEARPNVTVEAAALCLKSGNACLLRGSPFRRPLESGADYTAGTGRPNRWIFSRCGDRP